MGKKKHIQCPNSNLILQLTHKGIGNVFLGMQLNQKLNKKLKKTQDMAQVKENETLLSQSECLGIKGKHFKNS
jgi:hypothetical protein